MALITWIIAKQKPKKQINNMIMNPRDRGALNNHHKQTKGNPVLNIFPTKTSLSLRFINRSLITSPPQTKKHIEETSRKYQYMPKKS